MTGIFGLVFGVVSGDRSDGCSSDHLNDCPLCGPLNYLVISEVPACV